jgi:hypothetical protein
MSPLLKSGTPDFQITLYKRKAGALDWEASRSSWIPEERLADAHAERLVKYTSVSSGRAG